MPEQEPEPCLPNNLEWPAPDLPYSDTIQELHAVIEKDWDSLRRSACQTAAGRALWKHVIHDPLAEVLAGETYLNSLYEKIKKDTSNNAKEISGVILAVRTLWFDNNLEAAVNSFGGAAQVVLLGAGMDARAYRLSFLKESDVYEVDFAEVLQMKNTIIQAAINSTTECQHLMVAAKSLNRVAGDIKDDNWLEKLQISGFVPQKKTVWILEGFSDVKLSQIGDPDANYGLLPDPLNLFNKLRSLPRNLQTHPDDGTPCRRLYLVQGSGSPSQVIP
ncbi:uncharacterized protein LOC108223633 isoform X2 [Daucus carota subsp. sativus]|uniref:uncharacterized protein LOC108223633 isoform X2 n=1 Tax=Daucus carota subsp. sativus TaxID=79200 RepID=UPI0007F0121D|nr:PREDICTED: putative S-adenosyl-L-methionine-dependent methyltransferase MAB_0213c isoform X2 [Daucus carota subsp. sativus]